MRQLVARLVLLSFGLGITELGIGGLLSAAPLAWLLLGVGIITLALGSTAFIAPLLGAAHQPEDDR